MFGRLQDLESKYEEVLKDLRDPAAASDPDRLRKLGKLQAELGEIVEPYRRWKKAKAEAVSAREMLEDGDPELRALAEKEISEQEDLATRLEDQLRTLLTPKDPNDDKDVIVEVKAGEGGEESALFAADLFRMYQRYAEAKRWKTEILSSTPSDRGGLKEIAFAVKGRGAYSRFKHEAGVHRVQRVPETESQGRIHTSAAGVLVYPEAEDIDVRIDEKDLKIERFRSTGPGGQSVNTTDSAVRITHVPTGIVVSCQDEKSQIQNRAKAMRILRARLYQMEQERQQAEASEARRSQVSTVDRSQKIRTYNFPQSRVTDHRIGVSVHNLPGVMEGNLDPFIDALIAKERAELAGVGGPSDGRT
ncbi:MAG: peptide chain release factor 1 [Actinomycetota bacterium]